MYKRQDLNHAIPFKDVLNILLDISQNGTVPIYTWGDGDETALRETANIQQVEFPSVLNGMIDIRIVFQELGTSVKGYQSGTIYQAFGLPSPGKAHDALSDVQSIFNSLLHIVERDRTL